MTESLPNPAVSDLGNDLPPVQPPSAGFIIQLFVVPALIVLAVVAVWALFGRLAAGEQDWRAAVQDLSSANPHVYKRAMFNLAQLLDNDRRLGKDGQQLAGNPQIATALSDLLDKQLKQTVQDDESLSVQVYLSRALGLLDVPETTVPVLIEALDPARDVEVRKGAVTSVAMLAGRRFEQGRPLSGPIEPALVALSEDADPSLRRAAAFALGLVPGGQSQQRLTVLLEDPADWMTSVNAAIALSRQKSTAGYTVFVKSLTAPKADAGPEAVQEQVLILKNSLKAVGDLSTKWEAGQRAEFQRLITPLADDAAEPRIRVDARAALAALKAAG
jgi:HEAT repeat protein